MMFHWGEAYGAERINASSYIDITRIEEMPLRGKGVQHGLQKAFVELAANRPIEADPD